MPVKTRKSHSFCRHKSHTQVDLPYDDKSCGGTRYDWDPSKNAANKRKHKISFEEAETLLLETLEGGANYSEKFDDDHSDEDEDRFTFWIRNQARHSWLRITIGYQIEADGLLCERGRLISARWESHKPGS